MKRAFIAVLLLSTGCLHGRALVRRKQDPLEARADSLYWSAVSNLDPANKNGTLEENELPEGRTIRPDWHGLLPRSSVSTC